MKACIACKYFYFSTGEPGYSKYTPGCNASMSCDKDQFKVGELDNNMPTHATLLAKGAECPVFELSDLARSKGWTES